jgi:hypothetical protein
LVVGNYITSAKLPKNHNFSTQIRRFLQKIIQFCDFLQNFHPFLSGFFQKNSFFLIVNRKYRIIAKLSKDKEENEIVFGDFSSAHNLAVSLCGFFKNIIKHFPA